ncbi:hypothetical protein [Ancylobacter lacus]|uniref:hypothetical protein n=1 Tax=Ancylobacter lacus TaxID=2579970 RepID=UPI001BD1BA66|nr:hypothetical protein [Ancylobacter lacus]MBS7537946.1 hypothetical protein [Ancylobacter lacus]
MRKGDGAHHLERQSLPELALLPFEQMLAETLRGFLAELCLTNAGVVMAYISRSQDANIEDLVASSAELFMKPGRVRYARHATMETEWGFPPNVSIDMHFREEAIEAAFRVEFGDTAIGVHIDRIAFPAGPGTPDDNLRRFGAALASARIASN